MRAVKKCYFKTKGVWHIKNAIMLMDTFMLAV